MLTLPMALEISQKAKELINALHHRHQIDDMTKKISDKGKMYCATCVDSNKSAERLANRNLTVVTETEISVWTRIREMQSRLTVYVIL